MNDLINKLIQRNKELKAEISKTNIELSRLNGAARDDLDKQLADAYQRGLDDAWEAARKIADMWSRIRDDVLLAIFRIPERIDYSTINTLFDEQTASEAIEKLKAYEEKKDDEIHVGDVVVCRTTNEKGIATRVDKVGANVLLGSGHTGFYAFNLLKKTNKHNSSIEAILKRIRDEDN